jgi:hypothetical protein
MGEPFTETPGGALKFFSSPLPQKAVSFEELLGRLEREVLPISGPASRTSVRARRTWKQSFRRALKSAPI